MEKTKMPEKMNRLLRINEVAELLSIHPATLRRWDREGKLKTIRIGSRSHPGRKNKNDIGDRRYRQEDVEKYLKQ